MRERKRILMLIGWIVLAGARAWGAATVRLDWDAVTTNADGSSFAVPGAPTPAELSGYRVFYATYPLTSMTTIQAMAVGSVTKMDAPGASLSAAVPGLSDGTSYYFRLTAFDAAGNQSGWSVLGDNATDLEVSALTPAPVVVTGFPSTPPRLKEAYAYPNPAKGADPVIRAMMGGVESVEITIYDQAGRTVKSDRVTQSVTVNGETAYEYRWADARSGVYFAALHGKKGNETVRARAAFAVVR